jgi:hypothetical protein
LRHFFGQLKQILLLELPPTPLLNLTMPTTIILAVIHNVNTTLKGDIHFYKDFGINDVVDLTTVQCVVGRIYDRGEWAIVDRSDEVEIQIN